MSATISRMLTLVFAILASFAGHCGATGCSEANHCPEVDAASLLQSRARQDFARNDGDAQHAAHHDLVETHGHASYTPGIGPASSYNNLNGVGLVNVATTIETKTAAKTKQFSLSSDKVLMAKESGTGAGGESTATGENTTGEDTTGTDEDATTSAATMDIENFNLLNALRAQGFTCPKGKSFPANTDPLHLDCDLREVCIAHSKDMGTRNYFAHVTPDGKDPFDRCAGAKIQYPTFAENIAAGGTNAEETLEQWKKSDGHCVNMMDPQWTGAAVGYAKVEGTTYQHYWTMMLNKAPQAVGNCGKQSDAFSSIR